MGFYHYHLFSNCVMLQFSLQSSLSSLPSHPSLSFLLSLPLPSLPLLTPSLPPSLSLLPLSLSLPLPSLPSSPLPTIIKAYTLELEQMEKPASISPLISEKNTKIRALGGEIAALRQEMHEICAQREEHIQHMKR